MRNYLVPLLLNEATQKTLIQGRQLSTLWEKKFFWIFSDDHQVERLMLVGSEVPRAGLLPTYLPDTASRVRGFSSKTCPPRVELIREGLLVLWIYSHRCVCTRKDNMIGLLRALSCYLGFLQNLVFFYHECIYFRWKLSFIVPWPIPSR